MQTPGIENTLIELKIDRLFEAHNDIVEFDKQISFRLLPSILRKGVSQFVSRNGMKVFGMLNANPKPVLGGYRYYVTVIRKTPTIGSRRNPIDLRKLKRKKK